MIVFVDYEHPDGRSKPWGEALLAARAWITYRLEDLAGQHCMLVRYDRITPELVERLGAKALFISGNSTDPNHYDPERLEPLRTIVTDGDVPTFGFCGGFQFIADALGADVARVEIDPQTAPAERVREYPDGRLAEVGYHPVDLVSDHPLLAGLDPEPVVRHSHSLEIPTLPTGFTKLASTAITEIQMAVDDERRLAGTQFHPEYYTDGHPAGRRMIENFLSWAGVTAGGSTRP
jgi:GMP synthase (glutamine-hydrolysing)